MKTSSAVLRPPPQSAGPLPPREDPGRPLRAHRWPLCRRLRQAAALLVSMAVAAAGLAACGAGRDALGTTAGPCFAALPVARLAVHDRGELAGVRLVNASSLTARSERTIHRLLGLLPVPVAGNVCLVAYAGNFASGQVERPVGPPPPAAAGRYAIAVVTIPEQRLLATILVRREPLDFSRPHVGF